MSTETILIAFGLTLVAGLSTGIGSMLAFFTKRTNTKFLATSLGFSAGVMIYVSFMEMMPQAKLNLIESFGDRIGTFYLLLAFFGGMGMITLIDFLIPEDKNPHEMHNVEELSKKQTGLKKNGDAGSIIHRHTQLSGGDRHLYVGSQQYGNSTPHYGSYRDTQHSGRNCCISTYLSGHRE